MKKIFVILLIFFVSCNHPIKLNYSDHFPSKNARKICYLTDSNGREQKKELLLISSGDNDSDVTRGSIVINEKMHALQLRSERTVSKPDFDSADQVFSDGEFSLHLLLKREMCKDMDCITCKGIMIVKSNNTGKIVERNVMGSCGRNE